MQTESQTGKGSYGSKPAAIVVLLAAFLLVKAWDAGDLDMRQVLAAAGLALCVPYAYFSPRRIQSVEGARVPAPRWAELMIVAGLIVVVAAFVMPGL